MFYDDAYIKVSHYITNLNNLLYDIIIQVDKDFNFSNKMYAQCGGCFIVINTLNTVFTRGTCKNRHEIFTKTYRIRS